MVREWYVKEISNAVGIQQISSLVANDVQIRWNATFCTGSDGRYRIFYFAAIAVEIVVLKLRFYALDDCIAEMTKMLRVGVIVNVTHFNADISLNGDVDGITKKVIPRDIVGTAGIAIKSEDGSHIVHNRLISADVKPVLFVASAQWYNTHTSTCGFDLIGRGFRHIISANAFVVWEKV